LKIYITLKINQSILTSLQTLDTQKVNMCSWTISNTSCYTNKGWRGAVGCKSDS